MSDVKISEDVVNQLRLKELYRTTVMTVEHFRINEKSEIEKVDFNSGFPVGVPDQLDRECRFFVFVDLMTHKLKVVLWVGPNAPAVGRALYESCGDKMASIGSFPLVKVSTLEALKAAYDDDARSKAYKNIAKPILSVPREELLEYQPAWNANIHPHRRFANLFWVKRTEDNTFKLNRCRSDQAFIPGTGQPASLANAGNEALNLLADDVDVSGIVMLPEGKGLALTDAEKCRVWNDPSGGGVRTEKSESENEKVNAHARMTLLRNDNDKNNWTLSCTIGADTFKWLVFWFSWGHSYKAMAKIYRQEDWNNGQVGSPVTSASASGTSSGSRSITLTFDRPIGVNTGRYVWVWSYTRETTGGFQYAEAFRPTDSVVVNGEVVIDSAL